MKKSKIITIIKQLINKKTKTMKKLTKKIINSETVKVLSLAMLFTLSFISLSYAGTGGSELAGAYDKIIGLLQGKGGKIIMASSVLWGVIGSVGKFNPASVITPAAIGIIIPASSGMIDISVSALI